MESSSASQYQHFIPQFLLKNFAHPYKPAGGQTRSRASKGKAKYEKGKHPGDPVVFNVDLQSEGPLTVSETSIKRVLGKYDMYRDTTQPPATQQRIEDMLGVMESRASVIVRGIMKAFDRKEKSVALKRDDRNLLRKFLFIMKYRGSTFHKRFYADSVDGYNFNDRLMLREYMAQKGFERPKDVWFNNIETIINLEMDAAGKWIQDLPARMYRTDADWFILAVQGMYMAICTPSDPKDEFILTDNCYNIFEGPNNIIEDAKTGEIRDGGWANFHEFAPLSPRLIIILRSFVVPEEDANPEIREQREHFHAQIIAKTFGPNTASNLADLPIKKASNSYSRFYNGQFQLLPGEEGTLKKEDVFFFSFFPLESLHVNKINGFLLANVYSHHCSSIVFHTQQAFFQTLEWYMSEPCSPANGKLIAGDVHELRLQHLKNLAGLVKSMGSNKKPKLIDLPMRAPGQKDYRLTRAQTYHFLENVLNELPKTGNSFVEAYAILEGSLATLEKDVDQAFLMYRLRIKIDVWSKGVPEPIRGRNRDILLETYLQFPTRRFWFYMKQARYTTLRSESEQYRREEFFMTGPDGVGYCEDRVVRALARGRGVATRKLNRLLFTTVMNDIDRMLHGLDNDWGNITTDSQGLARLLMVRKFVFGRPGRIQDCGIAAVEKIARAKENLIRREGMHVGQRCGLPFLDDEQKVEVLTRMAVRMVFKEALGASAPGPVLDELMGVFFEVTYPTPPIPRGRS